MRRSKSALSEAIGTDAFLDIVANLVGILLIFMMVIGVRMEDASTSATPKPVASIPAHPAAAPASIPALLSMPKPMELAEVKIPDSSHAQRELARVKSSIRDAHKEAEELAELMKIRKLDRDRMMLAISTAEVELDKRRAAIGKAEQEKVAFDLELQAAQDNYQDLLYQLDNLQAENAAPETEVLQHLATPIAKTVFVREEHFRLKDGRLLYVPLNEMTNQLRQEAPKKVWKLKTASRTTETIGPREGFEMRYTLRRNRVPFRTESGIPAVREVVELDRFVMIPVGFARGETIDEAIQPTSAFRSRISGWSPRDTIVTVWAYPDSFGEFRRLKAELYKLGYLTAARPLPANQHISGSPEGTRSAAQ